MPIFEGQEFRNTTIHLDDSQYRNCTIDHCQVVYSGGPSGELSDCVITNCNFMLGGAALRTVQYMATLYGVPEMRHIVDGWINEIRRNPPRPAPPITH